MLKYTIKTILSEMESFSKKKAKDKITAACGWSETTWQRKLNARMNDSLEISAGELKSIAEILLVPMESLFNEPVKA